MCPERLTLSVQYLALGLGLGGALVQLPLAVEWALQALPRLGWGCLERASARGAF
jgi:hypothetical protein